MATMRMYCPSLKKNVEATITDGKQVASKGGSLRNILYGEYEGRKCLPKTVKAEVFAQHGFAAEFEQGHYGLMDIKNQKGDVVGSVGLENHGEKIPAEEVSVSVEGLNNDLTFVLNKRNKGSYNPYNAESATYEPSQEPEGSTPATEPTNANFEAYDDPISDRQEWKINSLGGTVDSSMNRSEASDYIKELQGRKSGTWKGAEYEDVMKDIENLSDDDYVDFCQYWGIDPDDTEELSSFLMKNKNSPDVQGWITGRLMGVGAKNAETFEAEEFVGDFNRATLNEDYWLACPNSIYSGGFNKNCKEVIRGGGYGYVCENCGDEFHESAELDAFKMAETFEAESSPSSFDISWEDAQGVSSPSLPPEGIHFAEEEGECEVCFVKNDGTGNLTRCNSCEKQICLGDMDACSSICGECGTYCCDTCLMSDENCANCDASYRAEQGADGVSSAYDEDEPRAIVLYDIVWKTKKDLPEGVFIPSYDEETLKGHGEEDIQDYLYERFGDYAESYKMQHDGGNYNPSAFDMMKRFPEKFDGYGAEGQYSATMCDSCEAIYPEDDEGDVCECGGTIRNLYEYEDGSADFESEYHLNGESCEHCAEEVQLNAEGFCSECYGGLYLSETMAAEGISRNGKLVLGLTALGVGMAMALGSERVASLLDKLNKK